MSSQNSKKCFQISRYTIKLKLIGIISLLILTALGGATFFASAFFSGFSRDAVNLASRIESLNKAFGTDLLISEDAYKELEGIFKLALMASIKVKGKSEPQKVYAVIGREDDPECPADLVELRRILGIEMKREAAAKDAGQKEEKSKITE